VVTRVGGVVGNATSVVGKSLSFNDLMSNLPVAAAQYCFAVPIGIGINAVYTHE